MTKLIVSPAPHVHSKDSVRRNMLNVIIALVPAYVVSIVAFGWGALMVSATSVVACVLFEWLIAKFILKQQPTIGDCSAILTGLLLALNLPSNLPLWIVIIGALVAIGVGKMTFGGLGQNPFNPALVGRVFLLISFPVQMTTWPRPLGFHSAMPFVDAETGATPLAIMKNAIKAGDSSLLNQLPDLWDLAAGYVGGSFGEVSAIALLIGGVYLLCTKTITWHIPVSIICTVAAFSGILCLALPGAASPLHHLLTGGLMLGAIFMATDYVTSPMTGWGQIIYGIGIGLIVVIIRTWGAYPEGMSFAILIMNAVTPLLNMYIRPKRFGEKKK
ncbi:MAG: RnfABCDGE type electron transport complex subunit D [Paludibacteraceae bacterium]|nr:RnfABCDGE type electron transport complex subunit D [Paludibacteraceae bacterium]